MPNSVDGSTPPNSERDKARICALTALLVSLVKDVVRHSIGWQGRCQLCNKPLHN